MLLRTLLETADPRVQSGFIFNPPRSSEALYSAIADDLDIKLHSATNPAIQLNRHLLKTFESGGTVVLIFDEAHDLPLEVLEEIRLLTNIETSSAKLLQVILAGQPELDAMLETHELRALRQRLVFRYSLAPLSQGDTIRYIASRLYQAGAQRSPFTPAACEMVHRYSEGVPRLINVICDNAMLIGYAKGSSTIEGDEIREVAVDLKLAKPDRPLLDSLQPEKPITFRSGRKVWQSRLAAAAVVIVAIAVLMAATLAMTPGQPSALTPLMAGMARIFSHPLSWLTGAANTPSHFILVFRGAGLFAAKGLP